jgi:hypothetical protein
MDLEAVLKMLNDKEYTIQSDDDTSSINTSDGEDIVEQGEGIYDGATSIDEMIERLEAKIKELRQLKEDGWELESQVEEDMAYIVFVEDITTSESEPNTP